MALSPSTRRTDILIKSAVYAHFGVPSYWIVDPDIDRIELFALEGGSYRFAQVASRPEVLRRLFAHYVKTPGDLPAEWLDGLATADAAGRAVRIADYIAGMTDRFAMVEHARIFGSTPELR